MSRLLLLAVLVSTIPFRGFANISGTATVNANSGFNFDTGTNTGTSGGDIVYTGTSITYQGNAKGGVLPGTTGASAFNALTLQILQALAALSSNTPIPDSSIPVNSIIALQTNGGNGAAFLVTAISSSSISFQYTTFTASGTGGGGSTAPAITSVTNNSSGIPSAFPNGGIAPSSIMLIQGSNLSSALTGPLTLQDSTKGLPNTLNGASASVSAAGQTYPIAWYYTSPTQSAGVLPAAVPAGTATLTYSYGGQTTTAQVKVVSAAFGMDVYNGNYAVLQDAQTGAIITPTHSASYGEYLTLWGSGVGSDPKDSDTTFSSNPQRINTTVQLYIGGVRVPQSDILYVGSEGYPAVQGIVFQVPSNTPSGCFDSVAVVTPGNVVSNIGVGSFMPNGGVCSDAYTGLTGSQISSLTGQTTIRSGSVFVDQFTSPGTSGSPTTSDIAFATFQQVSGASYFGGSSSISVGSCSLSETLASGTSVTSTALNPGAITVTPPSGSAVTLTQLLAGEYDATLPSGAVPSSGGSFTFTGAGGSGTNAVGPFTTSVTFSNPILQWTNQSAAATVTPSAGLTPTWTGGAANTYVIVSGQSSSTSLGTSGSYACIFPVAAGQGTVPAYILGALPAGNGATIVINSTAFTPFSATGLDYGYAFGSVGYEVNSVYQ